jgi:hypothetical protein
VCSVPLTPTGTTATLGAALDADVRLTGTITALNGKADSGTSTWKVINAGDTIALRWGV